jgi:hypothetical protein
MGQRAMAKSRADLREEANLHLRPHCAEKPKSHVFSLMVTLNRLTRNAP